MENNGRHRSVFSFFHTLFSGTSHLLWPERCIVCSESILRDDEGLCAQCWASLSKSIGTDYCRRCGITVSPYGTVEGKCGHCLDKEYAFDGILRVGEYETTLRSLILSFKFNEKTELANRLSRMLGQVFQSNDITRGIDMLVPVPLHWRRKLRRGYNQAHLLSKKIAGRCLPVSTDLVRIRNTEQQWNLTGPQRRKNVKNAFSVRKGHQFASKQIALIDDITTSGATLNECSKVLKEAGAERVVSVVLATACHDVI